MTSNLTRQAKTQAQSLSQNESFFRPSLCPSLRHWRIEAVDETTSSSFIFKLFTVGLRDRHE